MPIAKLRGLTTRAQDAILPHNPESLVGEIRPRAGTCLPRRNDDGGVRRPGGQRALLRAARIPYWWPFGPLSRYSRQRATLHRLLGRFVRLSRDKGCRARLPSATDISRRRRYLRFWPPFRNRRERGRTLGCFADYWTLSTAAAFGCANDSCKVQFVRIRPPNT
jgi:hypothetical protein